MRSTVIKLGSKEADRLGLTQDLFQAGIAFDSRPDMFYITLAVPFEDKKEQAFEHLLKTCDSIHTPVTIDASDDLLRTMSASMGWKVETDIAGTITTTNAEHHGRADLLKLLWQQQDQ